MIKSDLKALGLMALFVLVVIALLPLLTPEYIPPVVEDYIPADVLFDYSAEIQEQEDEIQEQEQELIAIEDALRDVAKIEAAGPDTDVTPALMDHYRKSAQDVEPVPIPPLQKTSRDAKKGEVPARDGDHGAADDSRRNRDDER